MATFYIPFIVAYIYCEPFGVPLYTCYYTSLTNPVSENRNNESRDTPVPTTSRTCENCIETQRPNTSAIPVTYTFHDLQSRLDDTERIPQFK